MLLYICSFHVVVCILYNFAGVDGAGDAESLAIPEIYKCDACRAIANRLTEAFHSSEADVSRSNNKPGSFISDVVVHACAGDFDGTGLKEIHGEKRLSAPGLEAFDAPGIIEDDGMWPERLRKLCGLYMKKPGDISLYKENRKGNLEKFLCRSRRSPRDACTPKRIEL